MDIIATQIIKDHIFRRKFTIDNKNLSASEANDVFKKLIEMYRSTIITSPEKGELVVNNKTITYTVTDLSSSILFL